MGNSATNSKSNSGANHCFTICASVCLSFIPYPRRHDVGGPYYPRRHDVGSPHPLRRHYNIGVSPCSRRHYAAASPSSRRHYVGDGTFAGGELRFGDAHFAERSPANLETFHRFEVEFRRQRNSAQPADEQRSADDNEADENENIGKSNEARQAMLQRPVADIATKKAMEDGDGVGLAGLM